MENSVEPSQKIKNKAIKWSINPTSGYLSARNENRITKMYMHNHIYFSLITVAEIWRGSWGHSGKEPPAHAGDAPGASSLSGRWRSPGEGNGNTLRYSCLDKFVDRGAWWPRVHVVALSGTWFQLSTHGIQNRYGNNLSTRQWIKGLEDIMCVCINIYISQPWETKKSSCLSQCRWALGHYAKRIKSDRERQILYDLIYM